MCYWWCNQSRIMKQTNHLVQYNTPPWSFSIYDAMQQITVSFLCFMCFDNAFFIMGHIQSMTQLCTFNNVLAWMRFRCVSVLWISLSSYSLSPHSFLSLSLPTPSLSPLSLSLSFSLSLFKKKWKKGKKSHNQAGYLKYTWPAHFSIDQKPFSNK